jgi:hypothetical protein
LYSQEVVMFPSLVATGLTLVLAAGNQVAAEGGIRFTAAEPPAARPAAQLPAAEPRPDIGRRLAAYPAWTRAERLGPADAAKVSNID